jgi:hypothetical protein
MDHFAADNAAARIKLAAEKLAVLLTGRYSHNGTEVFVLDGGRCWLPGHAWAFKLSAQHKSAEALINGLKERAAQETAQRASEAPAKKSAKQAAAAEAEALSAAKKK